MMIQRIFTIIVLILGVSASNISAKDYSDDYLMTMAEKGVMFFIKPQKMPRVKNSDAAKDLEYDITHITNTDSVSYTVSIYSKMPIKADSVEISYGKHVIKKNLERIYVEPVKSNWENRVRFYLTYSQFNEIYSSPSSFRLKYSNDYNSAEFIFTSKKWEKECKRINSIINIINQNK